ncbi:MAG: aspartyl protease family protein [Cytophagales bacterium]|nr:aspartyl protease family protein [Cytophagales bacterium]
MKLTTTIIIGLLLVNFTTLAQHPKILEIVNLKSKPIVKGVLNGKTAYFLLDTGSDLTILDTGSARKYGYKIIQGRSRAMMIEGLGGSYRDFKRAIGLKLFMDESLIYTHFFAFDLTNIISSLHANTGMKVVGIIGSDVMRKHGFKIDYGNKLVSFTSVEYKKRKGEEVDKIALNIKE